jgi:hypothetical protein
MTITKIQQNQIIENMRTMYDDHMFTNFHIDDVTLNFECIECNDDEYIVTYSCIENDNFLTFIVTQHNVIINDHDDDEITFLKTIK